MRWGECKHLLKWTQEKGYFLFKSRKQKKRMDFIQSNFILFLFCTIVKHCLNFLRKVPVLTTNLEPEIASYIKIGTMRNHKEGVCNPSFFCWPLSLLFFDYPVSQATFFTSLKQKKDIYYTRFFKVPFVKIYIFSLIAQISHRI